ncbi:hypothetical protein IWW48_006241 [Coemansia sp. RSA 1200]|nr:hypothetical protein IWW48_006241 [Coemansia sp. RSA 1200]
MRGRLRRRRDCSKMNIQHDTSNKEIDTPVTSSRSEDEGSIKSLSEDSSSDDGPSNDDGEEFTGTLTNYDVEENEGACGGMHTNDEMVAALNSDQFDALADGSSVYCGVCATIHGDKAKILVKIVDECPSCKKGDLDLSPAAFDAATTADGEAHDIMCRRQESLIRSLASLQPLAAICRSWRKAAIPQLYQAAVCSIRQRALQDTEGECGLPKYVCTTNIDLIVHGGYERYTHRLVIDLVGDIGPNFLVMQLEETGFSKTLWPYIKELQIYHWHGHTRRQRRSKSLPESLSKLNGYLLHNLPNLSSVEYNSLGDYRSYNEFPLNGLIASTLSRLTTLRIHSGLVPDLGASAFLPMLSSLTLNCPMVACAAHLPHIFAKSLVNLHIGFSSAETIWNRFYVGLGNHDLVFSKLRSLELEYTVPVVENKTCKCRSKDNSPNVCSKSQLSLCANKTYTLAINSSNGNAVGGGIPSKICGNRLESVYYNYSASAEGNDDTVISSDCEEFWATAESNSDKYPTCSKNSTDKLGAIWQQSPSFPHLEQLCICKYPYPVTNILRHFTVDQIPHVSIRDIGRSSWAAGIAAECVRDMKSLRVDVARSAFVGDRCTSLQHEEDDAERRYQVWINRLFSVSSATMKQLRLDAPTVEPVTLPDIVGLTNLTELSLGMKMDLGSVPNMLARLPRLLKLAMHVHPQSSWRLKNEGVLGGSGYSSQQDEVDDLRMLTMHQHQHNHTNGYNDEIQLL